jgi:hypothetical protein
MDPFDSYKLYNALKLHFETEGYDAIKYNFHTTISAASFFKRRDKYFFAKLAKTYNNNLKHFYVSQFINDVKYVGDMMDPTSKRFYVEYKKTHEALSRVFEKDINTLSDNDFDTLLESKDNQIPRVIQKWMEGDITLETLVVLNSLTGFVKKEGNNITETIIWPDISRKICKYSPFVRVDDKKYSNILKKAFTKSQ